MKLTVAKVALLSFLILASGVVTESPAYAAGTYNPGSGNGTVECSVSGFFTVSQHHVISNSNCSGNAHIPDEVVTIGASAFGGAWQLTSVSIPAMVDKINASAFYASNLQGGVTFRSGPRNFNYVDIGNFAFSSTSFSSIVLPNVASISSSAFEGNNALTDIYFLGNTNGPPSANGGNVQSPCHFCNLGIDPVAHVRPTSSGWPAEGTYWKRAPDNNSNLRGGLLVKYDIFDVIYDSNGGSPVDVGVLLDGIPISQPSPPTRDGYIFAGWSETDGGEALDFPYTPSAIQDISLYANWTANEYVITYGYNSATGGNSVPTASFTTGESGISLPTPTRTGYTFAGWYSDESLTSKIGEAGDTYSPGGSILALNVYAKWTANEYTISYTYNSATGGNSVPTASFTTGESGISLPTPTRTGYTFAGWYSDESLTSKIGEAGDTYSPGGSILALNVYAKWTANEYTISYTYNSATGGNSVSTASFTTGQSGIRLPTPTRTGYTFAGWYSDEALTSKIGHGGTVFSPNGSTLQLNVYAKWIRNLIKAASTVKPSVSGTAKVTKTLTANKGTWTGYPAPTVSYQWYACSSSISTPLSALPTTCKVISGANKNTFKIASSQKGKFITVLVTGSSAGTTKTIWLSKSTSQVK